MSDMIERVAEAIAISGNGGTWDDWYNEDQKEFHRKRARAAIEAMRDTTVTEDSMFGGLRVEVVPDDDTQADPRIPKDVLQALGPDTVLSGLNMMYIRASNWERIKCHFREAVPASNP